MNTKEAIQFLSQRGYSVTKQKHWQRPAQVAEALGIKSTTLCMKMKRFPGEIVAKRGSTGRIQWLLLTPELKEYLLTNKLTKYGSTSNKPTNQSPT